MSDKAPAERSADQFGLDRLIFFSDAVMAIAITLLVLDLKVPELPPDASNDQLLAALATQLPRLSGYATSFWVIGIYWVAHHRFFRNIVRYDHRLIQLNLLFLFFIAFVPYPTALLESYAGLTITVELYATTMVLIGMTTNAIVYYAARNHRLVGPEYTWAKASGLLRRGLGPPIVFFISMLIAPFNGRLAMNIWLVLLLIYLFILPRRD